MTTPASAHESKTERGRRQRETTSRAAEWWGRAVPFHQSSSCSTNLRLVSAQGAGLHHHRPRRVSSLRRVLLRAQPKNRAPALRACAHTQKNGTGGRACAKNREGRSLTGSCPRPPPRAPSCYYSKYVLGIGETGTRPSLPGHSSEGGEECRGAISMDARPSTRPAQPSPAQPRE